MRIALCQANLTVGDFEGNVNRVLRGIASGAAHGAQLVLTPELALTGCPPEGLVARPRFIDASLEALTAVAGAARVAALVGFADRTDAGAASAAALVDEGRVRSVHRLRSLSARRAADDGRSLTATDERLFDFGGVRCAVIGSDDSRDDETVRQLGAAGVRVVLICAAERYVRGRRGERERLLAERARAGGVWIAQCNLVGGQDGFVFDGSSVVVSPEGDIVARGASFDDDLVVADIAEGEAVWALPPAEDGLPELYSALVLGLGDYVRKNGFSDVVLGLSGGLDSAVVAAIAVDALGAGHVHGVLMPGPYSSEGSVTDALALAEALGIATETLPIEGAYGAFRTALAPVFGDAPPDVTEENLQARVRGTLLMALSNRFGWLVLTTGNKSEVSVGYSTVCGDAAGGFAPIGDVFKARLYELAAWRNSLGEVIPRATIEKPPSAELRPGQTDQDTLPPYEVLDPVLEAYVEEGCGPDELVAAGHDPAVVARVVRMVDAAEFKRRLMPMAVRVSRDTSGTEARPPVTNRFTG